MSTRVKICGITRESDAAWASEQGADAIGLVFYGPSPRNIADLGAARAIAQAVNPYTSVVALVVNPTQSELDSILASVPVNVIQFHGDESAEFCESYMRPYVKALRMKEGMDVGQAMNAFSSASGILLDTYKKGVPGGTGESFNWERVPRARNRPIVLAGGLTPENVEQAVLVSAPDAVDVSGGVESSPGLKDNTKVTAFIQAAKRVHLAK